MSDQIRQKRFMTADCIMPALGMSVTGRLGLWKRFSEQY